MILQLSVAGSYTSALSEALPRVVLPPATNTFPSDSSVAVWNQRGLLRRSVILQAPVAGSYSSANPEELPPTTSTFPFWSSVTV